MFRFGLPLETNIAKVRMIFAHLHQFFAVSESNSRSANNTAGLFNAKLSTIGRIDPPSCIWETTFQNGLQTCGFRQYELPSGRLENDVC